MDKISLFKSKRSDLLQNQAEIRNKISQLVDAESFVELSSYSYSHNDFYGESAYGEGVVTGFATINSLPMYLVAIDDQVLSGGLGKAMCEKIVACMDKALTSGYPIVYLVSSQGILAGEGVDCLEGVAKLLSKAQQLNGEVPQFACCYGKVLGQATLLVAQCDYVYYLDGACVAFNSPLVIAAKSNTSVDESKIGGANNGSGLCTFTAKDLTEVKSSIMEILDILPLTSGGYADTDDDLNRCTQSLNEKACAKCLEAAVFDYGKFVELGKSFAPEVVTGIGRVGGYSVAAIIFNDENGVELTQNNIEKIHSFLYYATDNNLPIVTFVNTLGVKKDGQTNSSTVLKSIADLIYALNYSGSTPKINIIYGKAIGLGYTLFGTKEYGTDYSFAFCTSKIGPVDEQVGAEMEYALSKGDKNELMEKFANTELDPFLAAKGGYVDDVIEPMYVRQFLIGALQMLV